MIAAPVNRPRARALMAACDLDAVVAVSPPNIGYFTGHFVWLDAQLREYMVSPGGSSRLVLPGFAVLPAEGEPTLVVHALFAASAAELGAGSLAPFGALPAGAVPGLPPRRTDGELQALLAGDHPERAVDALVGALTALGLGRARLGLEAEAAGADVLSVLSSGLPGAEIRDCTSLIRLIRAVKTDAEIRALAGAAAAAERAASVSLRDAGPGIRLGEIAERFRGELAGDGAALDHLVVGRSGLGITADPDYRLSGQEVTLVDFGCVRRHYFSDSGTTFAPAGADEALARASSALVSAIEHGAAALGPGSRGSEVSARMSAALEAEGIVGHTLPHGHGIGLEVRDYPILVPNTGLRIRDGCVDEPSDLPLEEGMVVVLEVSLHVPSLGSLHEEQTFVVDRKGSRPLLGYARGAPWHPSPKGG